VPATVAEHQLRSGRFGPRRRVRVDLHGVSVFGPGPRRALVRWEWIRDISVDEGVVVSSADTRLVLPRGAFGMAPEALAEALERARSIVERPDVIGALSGS
jgi:hypothetical protein